MKAEEIAWIYRKLDNGTIWLKSGKDTLFTMRKEEIFRFDVLFDMICIVHRSRFDKKKVGLVEHFIDPDTISHVIIEFDKERNSDES